MAETGAGRGGRDGKRLAETLAGPGRPDSHAGPEASFPWEDPRASPRSGQGILLTVTQDAQARAGRKLLPPPAWETLHRRLGTNCARRRGRWGGLVSV